MFVEAKPVAKEVAQQGAKVASLVKEAEAEVERAVEATKVVGWGLAAAAAALAVVHVAGGMVEVEEGVLILA